MPDAPRFRMVRDGARVGRSRTMEISRRDLLKLSGATLLGAGLPGAGLLGGAATAAPAGQRVFVGSYTSAGGKGIGAGFHDAATGRITIESSTSKLKDPSWLAVSGERKVLYAISEAHSTGTVNALGARATGVPSLVNTQRTGAGRCHVPVHPAGKYL